LQVTYDPSGGVDEAFVVDVSSVAEELSGLFDAAVLEGTERALGDGDLGAVVGVLLDAFGEAAGGAVKGAVLDSGGGLGGEEVGHGLGYRGETSPGGRVKVEGAEDAAVHNDG
jgi:hypothetical protein